MFGDLDFKPLLTSGLAPDLEEAAWGLGQAVSDQLKVRRFPTETCVSVELPLGSRFSLYLVTISLLANFIGISLCI